MGRGPVATILGKTVLLLCGAGIMWLAGCDDEEEMQQFLWLDHSKHESLNMDCASCHAGAREEDQAGIPSVRKCAFCHFGDRPDPPTPPELVKYIESGEEIPWIQINRYPGHVYFSHVAHVKYAEMDCRECHGVMKDRLDPTGNSGVQPFDMDRCMDCHREKQASVDCLTCHK